MLKAIIFDLDGVIADSHPVHESAWKALFLEQGLDPAEMDLGFLYAGHSRQDILLHYLGPQETVELERLGRRKDDLYSSAAIALDPKKNVVRLLSELSGKNILCALATSGGRRRAQDTLERFGIAQCFSAVVTAEDVKASKPSPEVFLLAAQKLGVEPWECVAVEDSVAGVQAAIAAGMICVGFAPLSRVDELRQAGAHDLIAELPEDAPAYFQRLFDRLESARESSGHAEVLDKRR